jgi:hypothetical protein
MQSLSLHTIIQENAGFNFEPASDARDVVDRYVAFGPLDAAEIGAIDTTFVRQRFLAEFTRCSKATHILRQNVPQRSLVSLFHRADFGSLTLLRRPLSSYIRCQYLQMRMLLRLSLERFEKFADAAQRRTDQSIGNTPVSRLRSQAPSARQQAGYRHLPALRLRMVSGPLGNSAGPGFSTCSTRRAFQPRRQI